MSRYEKREGNPGYDIVAAAPAYSNITGLVAGLALTAVVLAFTIAGTAGNLGPDQKVDLGFATTLFTLGFVGCLLCAYAFASLGGEKSSVATLSDSMLVGSGLSICIVAILGGFEALAAAFLEDAALVFLTVSAVFACVAQLFVWFPHWDTVQLYGPPDYPGPPQTRSAAGWLVVELFAAGVLWVGAGVLLHFLDPWGEPQRWEYLFLTFAGLAYAAGSVLAGLWYSTRMHRVRVSVRMTWALSSLQSFMFFALIALLP